MFRSDSIFSSAEYVNKYIYDMFLVFSHILSNFSWDTRAPSKTNFSSDFSQFFDKEDDNEWNVCGDNISSIYIWVEFTGRDNFRR